MNESFAGLATAANRAIELYYPEGKRLFGDPLALELLPFRWRLLMRLVFLPGIRDLILALRERRVPGVLGSLICRTRYIDDVLKLSLQERVKQVVILEAGFDTRAYRIEAIDQAHCFEVDIPGAIQLKKSRVEAVLGVLPEGVTWVEIDFDRQELGEVMAAAGCHNEEKTLFIWEGVTQYISAEAVDTTLRFVSSAAAVGSTIVFTYIPHGIIDGSDCTDVEQRIVPFASRMGSAWIFGFNKAELPQYLYERGLKLIEDVGAPEYRERYLLHFDRKMSIFSGERVAFAMVVKEYIESLALSLLGKRANSLYGYINCILPYVQLRRSLPKGGHFRRLRDRDGFFPGGHAHQLQFKNVCQPARNPNSVRLNLSFHLADRNFCCDPD